MVELSLLHPAVRRSLAGMEHGTLRIGDYEVSPSAAAEREPAGAMVWYGSAIARRVADGGVFNAAFDYYNIPFPSESEALAFAVQRTVERLHLTFGSGVDTDARRPATAR